MMESANSGVSKAADREVVVTRIFEAPRELVFRAWTEPEHAVHWYGPNGYTTPVCEMDVRTGGAVRTCMVSSKGSECWEKGIFTEVVVPERLVSVYSVTFEDQPAIELETEVTFEDLNGNTKLTVRQTFSNANFTKGAAQGTNESLDRLNAYLTRIQAR